MGSDRKGREDRRNLRAATRPTGWSPGVLALLALAATGSVCFPFAGKWLVAEDAFTHADVAVVLSGNPVQRSLAARDLYRQGKIDSILIIPEPPSPYQDELEKLGLFERSEKSWSERILIASGVPASRIAFLPEPADGTITEARHLVGFFRGRFPNDLVIVTSKFSSRRARFIFRRLLNPLHVKVLCYPSPYDEFQSARWWAQPRNALTVVMEYQKFLANAFILLKPIPSPKTA